MSPSTKFMLPITGKEHNNQIMFNVSTLTEYHLPSILPLFKQTN